MANVTIKGMVSAIGVNYVIADKEGKTLAVRRTEEEAADKAKTLKAFKPSVYEQTSSYLIGSTKYYEEGKEIDLPDRFKVKTDDATYNASVRLPVSVFKSDIQLHEGDSIELDIDKKFLEVETGNSPVFRATDANFKLKVTPNKRETAETAF